MSKQNVQGFLPINLTKTGEKVQVQWVDFSNIPMSEPFFDLNIINNIQLLSNAFVETDLSKLVQLSERTSSIEPKGFVFHMSRCGSTLLTNMLRSIQGTIAISEPKLLDEIFFQSQEESLSSVKTLFNNVVKVYSGVFNVHQKNFIIKYPSYSTLAMPLILSVFPNTPRIFLYRDPVEVLMSNLKNPSQDWMYWESLVGCDQKTILESNSLVENCALALKRTCELFLHHYDEHCLVIKYKDMVDVRYSQPILDAVLNKFSFSYTKSDFENALRQLYYYSKDNRIQFQSDSAEKRNMASSKITAVAEEYLMPVYHQLENLKVRF